MNIDVVVSGGDKLGEGVIWDPQTQQVMWTDIHGKRLHQLHPASGRIRHIDLAERLACFTPIGETKLLGGFAPGLRLFELETGLTTELHAIEAHLPTTRVNDGRVDRQGRLVFGTMDEGPDGPKPIGSIWSYDGVSAPRRLIEGIGISNSISFSPDGRKLYVADTPTRVIRVYDYDIDDGIATAPRVFVQLEASDGYPDGSTIDADSCLWNCEWGGSRVVRYCPDGRIDRVVQVPTRYVTCCSFGGSDLRTLYITSARHDLDAGQLAAEPEAGSLFAVDLGIDGIADTPFLGLTAFA